MFGVLSNCLNAISVGFDEEMLSPLSSDIYPPAFIVYYPIVDGSSADTGLLSGKEETEDIKEFKLYMKKQMTLYITLT